VRDDQVVVAALVQAGEASGRAANHTSADAKFLAIATPGVFGPAYFN
jgi:hypothetical protein